MTTVAARVTEAMGTPDLVGRGSGDEFLALLPDLIAGADAAETAERIRLAAQGSIQVAGEQIFPTVSVGIATGGPEADAEQLLRDASLALRKAKNNGRDRCEFADPGLALDAQRRISLEAELRDGLERGELVPWFQPIVSLGEDRVDGYEALVRWVHPDGTMEPDDFIPVAMRTGLMTEIDLAMIGPVVARLAQLPESMFVGVNVTGQTLARASYAEHVSAALTAHGVSPSRLHIEVTETMLLALDDAVVTQIRNLADLGCRWYVDDFGTGYSSISHLRDLPVSGLKLDKSFTFGIGAGERTDMQLAGALIGLANGLGLDTVAEGVETQAEADYLRTLGWRHGQGWLYGKAAPLP
jgi:predicted signal transduction protein with EAL and GGDEF domain